MDNNPLEDLVADPTQDPRIKLFIKRQAKYLSNHEVLGDHRVVNRKRLRDCCSVDPEDGSIVCSNPEGHDKHAVVGKKEGFSRWVSGKGQPYHNDLLPGQQRLKRILELPRYPLVSQ